MKTKSPFTFKRKKCPNCSRRNFLSAETCVKCGCPFEDEYTLMKILERKVKKLDKKKDMTRE
ncbi:MAG: hypothetical protein VB118_10405 [Oscillospiraceae bacterium]|nr:hypothetical protein [Oscillospiraceae bacterium]